MNCRKCGSSNVTLSVNSYAKSKSRSLLWNLLMIFLTGGLWIIWMLVRKKKEKVVHEKIYCCQNCGNTWK